MSVITVTVSGGTTEATLVQSGDIVNVTYADQGSGGGTGSAATIEVGSVTSLDTTATPTVVNAGTAYAAKLNFGFPRPPANSLSIGTVSAGTAASAIITGTAGSQVLSLTLPAGPATVLKIGTVVTGSDAAATLSAQTATGTSVSQTLNLVLPQGATGEQGIQGIAGPVGPANTLTVGSVTTTSASTASISITGESPSQQISFVVPRGPQGLQGEPGPYMSVQAGSVTTGSPGTQAKVDTVTSGGTVTLNFTIPRGVDGTANLGDETPQPLGVANAGTALTAARADHRHPLPSIAYSSLTGVPSTFTPAAHQHQIADVTNLQAVLDGKQAVGNYVTLVNNLIPSSVLPGFVDDVVDVGATLPETGDVGKLYVVSTGTNVNKIYRWSGSTFVEISPSPGSTDAVPEGSTNLYFTTARAASAAPVQSVNGKTGNVTIEAGGIAWSSVPTATTTVTKAGSISYDENFIYVANAVNQWRRTSIEDWSTPTITVSVQPSDQTAVGNAATFSVTASASQNAELLYQWQRQAGGTGAWVNVASGLSSSLVLENLQYALNNGDKYRVIISSGAAGTGGTAVNGWLPAVVVELTPTATVTSDAATLTVLAAISIVTQPQNVTLTNGTSASFSVSATTPGTGLSYQWQSSPDGTNWTNISGATAASYSLTGITETGNDNYRYRCVVSSAGYDDATSNAAILDVAPITVTSQPASATGSPVAGTTPNYTASFSSAASSPAGAPTIQWEVSTDSGTTYSDVSGQTSSSLSLTGLTNADNGKRYRAKFERSGWNTVRSNAATLTVPTDVITVTQQPANTTASVSSYSLTNVTRPTGPNWNASYANGKWFATPNDNLSGVYMATSDDGVTWTRREDVLPFVGNWSKVFYGNGIYLTFQVSGSIAGTWCATSTDGLTWTARQISSTSFMAVHEQLFLAGGGGWFVAFSFSSSGEWRWVQSQDGVNWNTVAGTSLAADTFTPSADGSQVAQYGTNSGVVLVANVTASGLGQFSSTGSITSDTSNIPVRHVIHDGSTWVAVVGWAVRRYTNPGWTTGSLSVSAFYQVAYRNGRYVAVTSSGMASSNDAITWVLRQSTADAGVLQARIVATTAGFWAVAGTANTPALWTSYDGLSWTNRDSNGLLFAWLTTVVGNRVLAINTGNANPWRMLDLGGLLSASLSSSATTTFGAPAIQWQRSTDGGATWANVSGATASPYQFTPTSGDNGARYRARYTKDSYTTVNSNAAILTVP